MGRYQEALSTLHPLAESHPEDPLTHFDVGLSLFRLGRLEPAVAAFQRVLAIVPDDAGAHLNLMLCYRRLMRLSEARREEAVYRNLRSEGGPRSLIDRFLAANPEEAFERTLRHEHRLVLKPAPSSKGVREP
jgi:tetratricopeptide (TPR) repeat protein